MSHPATVRGGIVTPDGLVVALRPLDPAAPWVAAWRDLAECSLVDNLFYHPDFALPAAAAFGADVQVALVGDRAPEEPGLRLIAAWPFRRTRLRWGLPLSLAMGWMHDFAIFGAPLLDAAEAARALDALLSGLRPLAGRRIMLAFAPTHGPFADLLDAACARQELRQARFWQHERAFLDLRTLHPDERRAYLGHLSSQRRRKLRQTAERLDAEGVVRFETIRDPAELASALDDYLALEARGWKGQRGTAMASSLPQVAMMHGAVAALGSRGAAQINRLRQDSRTLASMISFVTRDQIWTLKISFEEAAARHSPGAQLIHRLTQSVIEEGTIATGDSCAPPNFALPETFWSERLPLAHILLETPGGDPFFGLARWLEARRARGVTKLRAWLRARRHRQRT